MAQRKEQNNIAGYVFYAETDCVALSVKETGEMYSTEYKYDRISAPLSPAE